MVNGNQKNLNFDKMAFDVRVAESKKLLLAEGFLVVDPVKLNKEGHCSNINELVNFFYACMYENNRTRQIQPSRSVKDDRNNMSTFLRARKNQGISRNRALSECEDIIRTLFKNEGVLCLDSAIGSTVILTQKWAIDRAISILNNESAEADKRFRDKLERNLELLEDDEEKILTRLNAVYTKVVKCGSEKKKSKR